MKPLTPEQLAAANIWYCENVKASVIRSATGKKGGRIGPMLKAKCLDESLLRRLCRVMPCAAIADWQEEYSAERIQKTGAAKNPQPEPLAPVTLGDVLKADKKPAPIAKAQLPSARPELKDPRRMVVTLSFWDGDAAEASALMDLIFDLGDGVDPDCEFFLFRRNDCQRWAANTPPRDLTRRFARVEGGTSKTPANGFPQACNAMFYDLAEAVAIKNAERGYLCWLNLEPDVVPTRKTWLKEIRQEYLYALKEGKMCVGEVRTDPQPHLNGVAVYPADLYARYPEIAARGCPPEGWAYDIFHASQILPDAVDSPLFSTDWKLATATPERVFRPRIGNVIPTLFHGCKDGSAVEAVRKSILVSASLRPGPVTITQPTVTASSSDYLLPISISVASPPPQTAIVTPPPTAPSAPLPRKLATSDAIPAPTPLPATKLTVLVASNRGLLAPTVESLFRNIRQGGSEFNLRDVEIFTESGYDIFDNRNNLAARFLQYGGEWSLWMDDDVILPCGDADWFKRVTSAIYDDKFCAIPAINRLLWVARENNRKIVGGCYFDRAHHGIPSFHGGRVNSDLRQSLQTRGPRDEVMPTAWAATGCLLVHRQVYLDIIRTRPQDAVNDRDRKPWIRHANRFFDKIDDNGDDVSFCQRAREAGHEPVVDLATFCGHIGNRVALNVPIVK